MKKLSFQQKLWIPLICSFLCIASLFVYSAIQIRNTRLDERRNDLSNIVDTALNLIRHYGELEKNGTLTTEQAQQQAMTAIKYFRYGKDGYISINNFHAVTVMHPIKPELEGKNMMDFKDANGTYLYRNIVAAATSESGAGFVSYVWPRPGSDAQVPKLSRVASYKNWEWVIVTGVYTDDIDAAFHHTMLQSTGVLAGVCLLLGFIVTTINRGLLQAIGGDPEYATQVASDIAKNNLNFSIVTKEQDQRSIIYAMKTMQKNLIEIIGEIRRSADTIATTSSEIAAGNMDLSERTESQASSLEETSASMEELTATVEKNADNVEHANRYTQAAAETARNGETVVSDVIKKMDEITASSKKIVDIIGVIDDIAFQTNILALNAAVEAARAGENGRGCAVVASEVRNLAQRSATAAREIKLLIDTSVENVTEGSVLVRAAGESITRIMSSVSQVSDLMNDITMASGEQRTGILHVGQAITTMDSVTQQNAALVEEAAAAAASMQNQAASLAQIVSRFTL